MKPAGIIGIILLSSVLLGLRLVGLGYTEREKV